MRFFKKISALIIAFALFGLMPATAMAQENTAKEEVVYADLKGDGSPADAYVVNSFDMQSAGHIVDYGNYDSVTNLTTTGALQKQNGEIGVDAPSGRFYYQGNLSRVQLPWVISIRYQLNGNPVDAASLAGASGNLNINMKITDAAGANEVFTKNYMLQTTMTFNTELSSNIKADGATIANSGKNKVVSFVKLPGKDADYTVTVDVQKFEMAGIQIAGVPLNMDIGDLDTSQLTDGLGKLQDGIGSLDSGANNLSAGAQQLNEGSGSMTEGLQQFQGGMGSIRSGMASLVAGNSGLQSGSQQILEGLKSIQANLASISIDTSDLSQLATGSAAIASGINRMAGGLAPLSGSFAATDTGINAVTGKNLHLSNADAVAYLSTYPATASDPELQKAIAVLQAEDTLISGLKIGINGDGSASNPGIAAGMTALNTQYASFDAGIQALPAKLASMASGLSQLKGGIDQLASNYASFHGGLLQYTNGVGSLYDGYAQLDEGFNKIVQGSAKLSEGASSFAGGIKQYASGVDELHDQTKNMDSEVQKQIDDMMKSYTGNDFTPVSFVSDKNTNVKSVQFVMMTEEIKTQKPEAIKQETSEAGFWDRLLSLFGIHK